MSNDQSLWPGLVFGFVIFLVWMPLSFHHALSFTAKGIVKRLRRSDRPLTMRVPWLGGSWNPSRPEKVQYQLVGPGRAVYRLIDETTVEVDYSPRWGSKRHFSGPIPPRVDELRQRHLPPLARKLLTAYVVFLLAGAVVGGLIAHGGASNRAAGAAAGFLIAMVVASVAVTGFVGVRSYRHPANAQSPSKPANGIASDAEGDVWRRVERNERIARRYLEEHDHHPPT